MKIFAFDGGLARSLERIFDLCLLHLLWVVCSIPIVTIGASTTALCTVTLKMAKKEDGYVWKAFFKAFKENFKKSTILWMAFLAFFVWCVGMIVLSFQLKGEGFKLIALVEAALLFMGVAAFQYVFFIQAHYENTIGNTIKNAITVSLRFLPQTALLLGIFIAPILVTAYVPSVYAVMLTLWLFFGSSLLTFAQAHVVNKVFEGVTDER